MFIFGALRSLPRRSSWNNKRLRYIDASDTPPRGFRAKRTKIKHLATPRSALLSFPADTSTRGHRTRPSYTHFYRVKPPLSSFPPPLLPLAVRCRECGLSVYDIAAPLAHGRISRLSFTMIMGSSGFPVLSGKVAGEKRRYRKSIIALRQRSFQ